MDGDRGECYVCVGKCESNNIEYFNLYFGICSRMNTKGNRMCAKSILTFELTILYNYPHRIHSFDPYII